MASVSSKTVRTGVTFIISFGLGKGAAFCAALALPRLVDANLYGVIELSLTLGALGASIFGLGAPAVAVKALLVDDDPQANGILFGHCIWLSLVALLIAGGLIVSGQPSQYVCGAALIGLFGFQSSATAYARMRGHIHLTGWLENSSIVFMFLLTGLMVLTGAAEAWALQWRLIALSLVVGAGALVLFVRERIATVSGLIAFVVRLGTPMMFFGLSQMLLFGTARIAIARELSLADVASFSLCARITLVLVFASQVPSIGLFRPLYRLEGARIARYFTFWIVILSGIATILTAAAYWGARFAVVGTDISTTAFFAIFPAIAIQTTLWVLNSNLEMFVVRDLISRQAAIACFVVIACTALAGVVLSQWRHLGLMDIIDIYSAAMAVMLVVQMRLLARKGVKFRAAYFALPVTLAPWLFYALPAPA